MLRLLYNRYFIVILVICVGVLVFGGWRLFRSWLKDEPADFPQLAFLINLSRRDKIVLASLFVWLIALAVILAYFS